jgi:hypothetical protein
MNARMVAVLLAIMLSACTRTVWQRPGATAEEGQRDSRECDRQADRQAGTAWDPGHVAPFSRTVPPSLRQSEHRRRYASCMSARGYVEVKVPN